MVHLIIQGYVHGVGFRQFIKSQAIKLSLDGWATNLPNGTIEVVFDGEKENVEKMIEICRIGPFLAQVKNVKIDWNYKSPADIIGFSIIK
ncbi:MAG: acylphosphatase, partial [Patescibacteria group bacterium]